MSSNLVEHFSKVKNPKIIKNCDHLFIDTLVIAIYISLCRFDESWKSIEGFAHFKKDLLKKFLKLSDGIPSCDIRDTPYNSTALNTTASCLKRRGFKPYGLTN